VAGLSAAPKSSPLVLVANIAMRAGRIRGGVTMLATGSPHIDALQEVVAFFEERRGQLHGFRWRDRLDHSSAVAGANVTPLDQAIGTGDGATVSFALSKTYGGAHAPYVRPIAKPVAGSVVVAIDGTAQTEGVAWSCDTTTGVVTFQSGHVPADGADISAGFLFDVPVRFDTDYLEVDLSAFTAGIIPKIPLIEIRP
jgi:uncharacterized protein (TIGR02217 family)